MIENSRVVNLLRSLNPSETALLDWLEPHIDDALLEEIAAADYGFEEEEHFQALKRIHQRQPIPVPLPWVPREVLELIRWSEPGNPTWKPGATGTRGHLMRTFCCTVLLSAAAEPQARFEMDPAENETIVQLLDSVFYLGHDASQYALRFFCWRTIRLIEEEDDDPFFALAILLLCAFLFEPDQDGAYLGLLAEWVLAVTPHSEVWLLGLTSHNQRHEVWKRVAREILLNPAKSFPEPAAAAMRDIVQRLVPENQLPS